MERPGSSTGNSSSRAIGDSDHPGGPSLSSPDPANRKRPSTTVASAAIPHQPTLQLEGDVAGSSSSTTTLHDLLKRDIEPKGQRNFIPFFRHNDLLRLSECSKDLVGYRHHLSQIHLSNRHLSCDHIFGEHGSDMEVMKGIMGLLSAHTGAGGSGLDCLEIDDHFMLKLFRAAAVGDNRCRVKKLQLFRGDMPPDGDDVSRKDPHEWSSEGH